MAAGYCNPTQLPRTSPFRATQLWNEAVSILQSGMPTRRHFHRMRYYDNCFSGKEAVEWLSQALFANPSFGNNVTVEGTQKLLQHFLKSGVFQSVKGNLTFKDSGLYELVNRTIPSPSRKQEHKAVLPQKCLQEIDPNAPQNFHQRVLRNKEDLKDHWQFSRDKTEDSVYHEDMEFKDIILKRIDSLLPTLGIDLLLDPETIRSDWVKINLCPQYQSMRNSTELPFWVFTAITSVINRNEKEYVTCQEFEKQVYNVVKDYLRHRSIPIIPFALYEVVMYTFNHLHYSDLEKRLKNRDSVENLMLSMSSTNDWSNHKLVSNENLTATMLPPNSCFETAFTSDEPVTRIVPQSSVDTICLSTRSLLGNNNRDISRLPTKPVLEKNNRICDKLRRKCNTNLRRTQSMAQIDAKRNAPSMTEYQSYVNLGLSQSLDDLLVEDMAGDDGSLDLEEAMRSVQNLMRATTVSDSFDSLSTVDSCVVDPADLVCIDSCQWLEDVQTTARSVFQLLLLLLPPVSRTSLRMLLQFIDRLCIPSHSTITKTEIVYDLSAHILSPGPQSKNVYSHHMVLSVVYFLVDNCKFIFQELHVTQILNIMDREKSKENLQNQVYCEQVTGAQFQDQGVTSSWLALAELLDQILSDTKMKTKEKKKRLKKFKEAYPHIYKQRLGSSSTSSALLHFR